MENVLYLSILDKKMGPNKSKRDFGSGEYRIYIYIYTLLKDLQHRSTQVVLAAIVTIRSGLMHHGRDQPPVMRLCIY